MLRWILLACCFVLGACKTVTPPVRSDVPATGVDSRSAAAVNLEGGAPRRQAGLAELAPPVSSGPSVGNKQEGGIPRRQAGLAESLDSARDREPVERLATPARSKPFAEPVAVPAMPRSSVTSAGSLPLPLSSPARHGFTNDTASLPVTLQRGGSPPNPPLAQTLDLPFLNKSATNKMEGGTPRRQAELVVREDARPPVSAQLPVIELEGGAPRRRSGLAESLDSARDREPVERLAPPPIALPPLPATRQDEGSAAGGTLPLPASSSVRRGDTNAAARLPVTIPQWVVDAQMENAWREAELNRQAQTQKEREEQFQQFRRAFYQFLSVKPVE